MKLELRPFQQLCLVVLVCSTTWVASGCSMIPSPSNSVDFTPVAGEAAENKGTYKVRMESAFGGKPTMFEGELSEPMTIQEVLKESRALKKYRHMDITIMRAREGAMRPVKMMCEFEPARRAVKVGQDYAIHPGDRILIQPKEATIIGQWLNQALGSN